MLLLSTHAKIIVVLPIFTFWPSFRRTHVKRRIFWYIFSLFTRIWFLSWLVTRTIYNLLVQLLVLRCRILLVSLDHVRTFLNLKTVNFTESFFHFIFYTSFPLLLWAIGNLVFIEFYLSTKIGIPYISRRISTAPQLPVFVSIRLLQLKIFIKLYKIQVLVLKLLLIIGNSLHLLLPLTLKVWLLRKHIDRRHSLIPLEFIVLLLQNIWWVRLWLLGTILITWTIALNINCSYLPLVPFQISIFRIIWDIIWIGNIYGTDHWVSSHWVFVLVLIKQHRLLFCLAKAQVHRLLLLFVCNKPTFFFRNCVQSNVTWIFIIKICPIVSEGGCAWLIPARFRACFYR